MPAASPSWPALSEASSCNGGAVRTRYPASDRAAGRLDASAKSELPGWAAGRLDPSANLALSVDPFLQEFLLWKCAVTAKVNSAWTISFFRRLLQHLLCLLNGASKSSRDQPILRSRLRAMHSHLNTFPQSEVLQHLRKISAANILSRYEHEALFLSNNSQSRQASPDSTAPAR